MLTRKNYTDTKTAPAPAVAISIIYTTSRLGSVVCPHLFFQTFRRFLKTLAKMKTTVSIQIAQSHPVNPWDRCRYTSIDLTTSCGNSSTHNTVLVFHFSGHLWPKSSAVLEMKRKARAVQEIVDIDNETQKSPFPIFA